MWCGNKFTCIKLDSVSERVVDTLLTILTNDDGVGKGGGELLLNRLVFGQEEVALANIGVSYKTLKAVVMWMDQLKDKIIQKSKSRFVVLRKSICQARRRSGYFQR